MRKFALLLAVASFPIPSSGSIGGRGASFLDIPTGATPASLGAAYTARATDAYAPLWNPGGLGFLQSSQVAAQQLNYLDSIQDQALSIAIPVGKSSGLGVSAQYLGSGSIDRTDALGTSIGSYSDHLGAYGLSFGHAFGDQFSAGVTAKWIHQDLDNSSASTFAADIGTVYKANRSVTLAATLMNSGGKVRFDRQESSLPQSFHLSAHISASPKLSLSAEWVAQSDFMSGRIGTEWQALPFLNLRLGYRTDALKDLSPLAGISSGFGLVFWGQEFSYAWMPLGDLGNAQYLSIVLRFKDKHQQNLSPTDRPTKLSQTSDEIESESLGQLLISSDEKNSRKETH